MKTLPITTLVKSKLNLISHLITGAILFGLYSSSFGAPEDWMSQIQNKDSHVWETADAMAFGNKEIIYADHSPVALSCLPFVNVSLGQQGYALITPLMLVNAPQYPAYQYTVDIMGPLTNTVYCEQIGQDLMVVVTELPTGNSCMSTIHVEDKLKPLFSCTPDTFPCNVVIADIDFYSTVEVQDNCDPDPELWYSYVIQPLPCNQYGFTAQVLVNWTATDASGNSSTCQDIIYLKKPSLGQIVFPPNISVSCSNPNIDPSITGVPTFNGEPVDYACQLTVWYNDVWIPMCSGAHKVKRTWTIMDWCNSGVINHVQEILIIDSTPPVLTCPASITINTNQALCTAKYTLPPVQVTDNCANPSDIDIDFFVGGIPGIYSTGQMVTLPLGVTAINVRATDPCGNSSMCQYTVTVKDNLGPVIICPPNVTVDCNASTAPSATGTATATDYCDPTPTITYNDVTMATAGCAVGYKINRTWMAVDNSGNISMCVQMITLTDNTPPVISCPANVTITCTASTAPANTGSATASDHCDASPIVSFNDTTTGGSCPEELTIHRTWIATDACGNSSTCLQNIFVIDNTPPLITCPPDLTIECSADSDPSSTGSATATDNCDATPTLSYSDITTAGGPQTFIINRTWVATDDCGNSSTCIQLILVHDATPPVITCPDDIAIECSESILPFNTGTATATDNCDPAVAITHDDNITGGACPQEETITRIWTATDACGNTSTCEQTIFVNDHTAPEITCPSDITILCTDDSTPATTGTATATDNCDPAVTITFTSAFAPGICPQEGTITRTWTAVDDCGNSSSCTQLIFVDDNQGPIITCPSNTTINCGENTLPVNTGTATATDNCTGNPIIGFSDVSIAGLCPQAGTITRTWTAQDGCGNSNSCVQTIVIIDNQAPDITCPSNVTIQCAEGTLPATTGTATATDNCTANPIVGFSDVTIAGSCPQSYNITRTWTAQDGCGNSSSCTQFISVLDTNAPVITCPDDVNLQCGDSTLPDNTGTATAIDGCDQDPIISFSDVITGGGCPASSAITRTWTAEDHCGNSSTCVQLIFIDDSSAPSITCPQDVTLSCNDDTSPENTGTATAVDNCDANPSITFSDVQSGGSCPEDHTITRTWVATDECGNSSTCNQIILVQDNQAPAVSCPANMTVECTASTAPANTGTASATDVCDANPAVTFSDATIGTSCPNVYTINRTWSATDACGNVGTCLQVINVDDTTAPVCSAMDITVALGGNGMVVIQGSDVDNGSSDSCGPVTLDVTPNTFDCTNIGVNPVILTVTDCSGNTSTCSANVTINDNGGLQASCQNVTIFLDANGIAMVTPQQVDNGSGGGCNSGNLTFDLSQTTFDCGDTGPNIVTLTVTDQNGNTATCTAIITVIDNMPPSITCPANLTVQCQNVSNPDNTSQFGNATGDDNCGTPAITETHVLNLSACNVGTILRTFTATDASGNTATCTQMVTITNTNPLGAGDITWPTSPLSVNICNSTDPPATGIPVINPQALQCANVVVSHTDVVQMFIDNNPNTPCKVITRTWTVTDLCQQNATFTFVQTINVQDPTPPLFTNINDMTKTANANCVAFFTLIANATDCSGVTITNNSPYGATSGANASGNYPVGVTTVIFTATDGCGNISTMDVVLTVIDLNPTQFMCEKIVRQLPPETEITISAKQFVTIIPGGCSNGNDFAYSYSNTLPFDSLRTYDCGDVGVQTFPLYFWTADGSMLVDSCNTADLEIDDPNDYCMDGLAVTGNVRNEEGYPISDVEVSIMNAPMTPDTTDGKGNYIIHGLAENSSYALAPYSDRNPKEGVSTLDLVLIQKHLLGKAKLNSPYKLIAADANKSGVITALDLLEIRKLILGITNKFQNNTSWRFVDKLYQFPDPYNPFNPGFPESVWLDSLQEQMNFVNFIGIKVGDVNGSFFATKANGEKIESRSAEDYEMTSLVVSDGTDHPEKWEIRAEPNQRGIDGFQFSLAVGPLTNEELKEICSDVLPADEWYYDPGTMTINVSWSPVDQEDLSGKLILCGPITAWVRDVMSLDDNIMTSEAYQFNGDEVQIRPVKLTTLPSEHSEDQEYHLYQNIPNPFNEGTIIRFSLPKDEQVHLIVHDITGRKVVDKRVDGHSGLNDVNIRSQELGAQGVYYYTLQTLNASLTRKMSYTTY